MRDEVLDKALSTDSGVVVRYDIVRPDGTKVAENCQIILKNPILTPGMPLQNLTLLSDETAAMLGMDPAPATPDEALQRLAALAASGGGGGGDTGELEDFELETGSFTNAGAGWNTCKFKRPFASPPQLFAKAKDFEGILQIKDVTVDGFLYQLRTTTVSGGSVSTGSYYTASGTAASSAHTAQTLVSGVTLPTNGATSAAAATIQYLAVHFGGER